MMGINFKNFRFKKTLVLLLLMGLSFLLNGSIFAWQSDNGDGTFTNPPLYADYPDPSIVRVGNDFYFASTTFVNVPGLVILHSQDLVNWEIAGHCISSFPSGGAYDMIGGVKYAGGCFAPSIAYKNGTFYVVVTPNGEASRIYYATDVAGPWNYYQLSGSYFDPCLFIESDGTPYLAWGGAWENSIKMIQLNSNLSGTTGSQKTILSYNNIEGSHLVKRNGWYYLFNAVPAQKLVCSRASTLWGPYGETTTLCQAGSGGHQGGIVDMPDGSYWGYIMQDDGGIGRMTRICPIIWQNNWPMFGRTGHLGTVESSYTKPIANKPVMVPATSDEFNGSTLGLQWMWNHNPDNTKWSFTGTALRLKATTGSDFWHARNTLTQKGQGPTSSGSIRIDCSAIQSGDICGLGMLGDPRGYIAVTKGSTGKKIIMSEEDSVKATVSNITANILYFRVEMNFSTKQAKFFWKDDSTSWQQLGTTLTMGFDIGGTFQGEQYAILCFNPSGSSGYMDVDWFRLNDIPGPGVSPTPSPTPTPTATVTPTLTPTPGTGNYIVVYTIQNDWGSGATVDVKIINNTTTAVNGWTLAWTFPGNQTITNLWNGTYTQSGASVTVKNASYNANIPANGGSLNFGFNLNYSGANAKPASFTLNGTACQVQ
jgi:xylan 1,4-beta-xylosidase